MHLASVMAPEHRRDTIRLLCLVVETGFCDGSGVSQKDPFASAVIRGVSLRNE